MKGVSGTLPPDCPPPFNHLLELSVAGTGVEGEVPECLVNTVHRLEISNTKLGGRFPEIKANAELRYAVWAALRCIAKKRAQCWQHVACRRGSNAAVEPLPS